MRPCRIATISMISTAINYVCKEVEARQKVVFRFPISVMKCRGHGIFQASIVFSIASSLSFDDCR
jgi:hypothetical protein